MVVRVFSFSAGKLAGTCAGMTVLYLVPPVSVVLGFAGGGQWHGILGSAAWAMMCVAYVPTLKLYGQPNGRSLLLPVAALLFTCMTISSAFRHWRGGGGAWKGRSYGA